MSTLLPLDDNGNAIPALGFDYRGCHKVGATSISNRNGTAIAADIRFVTVIATGPCRFEIGDSAVTADASASPFLFEGHYLDVPLKPGERHIAFIAESADCDAYIIGRI
jgi:hypothetical protein